MAIVINSAPASYSSLHGDLIFTVYEATKATDPVTYPNYKYVCDVYIGGTLAFRAKAFPNPVNKRGVFNIAAIVRNYMALQFNPSGAGVLAQQLGSTEFYLDVQCKFGEEYAYTTYLNVLVDSSRRFYNHYNNQIYSTTTILGDYVGALATNRPYLNSLLYTCSKFFVPFFSTSGTLDISVTASTATQYIPNGGFLLATGGDRLITTSGDRIIPTGFDGGTSSSTSTTATHSYTVTAGSLQILNLSPVAINADMPGIINGTTDSYVVTINGTVSIQFRVADERIFTPYTVHFLNQLGGVESIDFRKLSRKTYDVEKKSYVQQPFRMDGSGVISYSNAAGVVYETGTTYSSQFKQKMRLSTELLFTQDWKWLKELIFSPLVYLQDGSYIVPVSVTNNNYEEIKFVNERAMKPLVIDIEFGVQLNAQYR
jgi:hypothetical protein